MALPGLNPDATVYFTLAFSPQDAAALQQSAQLVSSGQSGQFSASELTSRFGLTQSQFSSVLSFLESRGMTPTYVSPGRMSVTVSGKAGDVESLLGVSIVVHSGSGASYYSEAGTPQLPAQLAGAEVIGLTNQTLIQPQYIVLGQVNQSGIFQSALPRSVQFIPGLQFSADYYGPGVFQQVYNETPLLSAGDEGQGQTIAIIDAYGDPTIYQDLQSFDSEFGLPAASLSIIPIGAYQPEQGIGSGWDTETALDVEVAHMMAPMAHIDLLVANGADITNGLFDALDMIATEGLANITSMSWGSAENLFGATGFFASGSDNYPYLENYLAMGTAEGMTFFAASGDGGAYGGTPTSMGGVSYPASSPYVTGVGGTTLFPTAESGSLNQGNGTIEYTGEDAWSISPQYFGDTEASGGGSSTFFSAPSYQEPVTGGQSREVPDVSADSNPYSGAVVVIEGLRYAIGGTSLATPMWAGMTAVLNQYLGYKVGLLNVDLYQVYKSDESTGVFHNVSMGYNGAYYAGNGYNEVTGLGTPNFGLLANDIKDLPQTMKITVSATSENGTPTYPQFNYGDSFEVSARATLPGGGFATTGSFSASVYTSSGLLETIPMTYNGSDWVASVSILTGEPPNEWEVQVSGQSGGYAGVGTTSIDVGLSVNIISPLPYPLSAPLDPTQPFVIQAEIDFPNGSSVTGGSYFADFYQGGTLELTVPLFSIGFAGIYEGDYILGASFPQGVYTMVVEGADAGDAGRAYTYEYFGEAILDGGIITPVNGPLPTAAPGDQVTFVGASETPEGMGLFNSNMTADVYSQNGTLVAQVPMQPAPDSAQFGYLDLFYLHEANFTIPANMTAGFYTVKYVSVYGTGFNEQQGEFTTGFQVSPGLLNVTVSALGTSLQGQDLLIKASINYSNGTEATSGIFLADVVPVEIDYAAAGIGLGSGVSLQYDPGLGEWIGVYQLPDVLSGGFYLGTPESTLSGPWNVIVAGEAPNGEGTPDQHSYFEVLPYTIVHAGTITPQNASAVPLASYYGGVLSIADGGGSNLTIQGLKVSLSSGLYSGLTLVNCTGTVTGSSLSDVTVINSTITFSDDQISDSRVGLTAMNSEVDVLDSTLSNLTYAFDPVSSSIDTSLLSLVSVQNLSTSAPPLVELTSSPTITFPLGSISLKVTGPGVRVEAISVNGAQVNYTTHQIAGGYSVSVPFNPSSAPDGAYAVQLTISGGLVYTQTITVINAYHSSALEYAIFGVALVALVLSILVLRMASRKRDSTSQQSSLVPPAPPTPQTAPGEPEIPRGESPAGSGA